MRIFLTLIAFAVMTNLAFAQNTPQNPSAPPAPAKEITFTVTIENVSQPDTLKVPNAQPVKAVIAPGLYAVSRKLTLFKPGKPAGKEGLEALAEDGNFDPLMNSLKSNKDIQTLDMFVPGQSFSFKAKPGDRLAFATMFVQSNDKFYGFRGGAIRLFNRKGVPLSGDITKRVVLFDAGTEADEQPGAGPNQAPRQKGPNTGISESKNIQPANDGFAYPEVKDVIKVTIRPAS